MKPNALWLILPLIVAAGCKPSASSNENGATNSMDSPPVTQQWQNVKSNASNAWQDVKQTTTQAAATVATATTQAWAGVENSVTAATDYSYDQKDAFVTNFQSKLDALDQDIKRLSDKAANVGDAAKADAQTKLQDLQAKRADLSQKFDHVKNATATEWDAAKNDLKSSYDGAKSSVKQAWEWIGDKLGQ